MARTSSHRSRGISAFLVPKEARGLSFGKQEKKMGLLSSPLAQMILDNVHVPESFRLGEEGQGLEIALSQLDAGRITIGVGGVALALAAIEKAWTFFLEKEKKWNAPLEPSWRETLAYLFTITEGARALNSWAISQRSQTSNFTLLASQSKLLGSEVAVKVCSEVMTLVGPESSLVTNGFERLLRDARALPIVEGTNQIQQLVISREMEKLLG